MHRLLRTARTWAVRLGFAAGRLTGPADRVVLATAHADRLSGNLALIAAEVRRRGRRPVVLVHAPRRSLRGRLAALAFHVRAGAAIARAAVLVVDDYFFPLYVVRPRPTTTVAQVWHAGGALKKFGYSVLGKTFGADEDLVAAVRIHANYDLCLVSSEAATPFYAEAFRLPPESFVSSLGIPRTDLLFGADREARAARVRERYGIPADRRVVLYAPTFRGERIVDARADHLLDFEALAATLAADHVVLVRLHPFVRARLQIPAGLDNFLVDVSDAPEINELMLASDVLVTDYSSAVFEFALLGRPIVVYAPDLEAYERERDLYIDIRTLPGPVLATTEAVAAWLRAGEVDEAAIIAFARRWFTVADGQATVRFVDRVVEPALRGEKVTAAHLTEPAPSPPRG
ncbi:MAG TPA: CDP-glycerol glycerophosphotransferase family protein [Candidatus Limnocylindrales bacterium]|nr:CDP-glycerol glycerophosphotransferase family protein [Candidatus Limnocylindrales bacterium]